MTIERAWIGPSKVGVAKKIMEPWKEISEDRASRDLANAHGDNAIEKLKKGELKTRFAHYRIV